MAARRKPLPVNRTAEAAGDLLTLVALGLLAVQVVAGLPWQRLVALTCLTITLIMLLRHWTQYLHRHHLLTQGLNDLHYTDFERRVAALLADLGWQHVRHVGGRSDKGVDITGLYNKQTYVIQCKHYKGRLVTPNDVRALLGTVDEQQVQRGLLVTSGRFGEGSWEIARKRPVDLWDADTLLRKINAVEEAKGAPKERHRYMRRRLVSYTALALANTAVVIWAIWVT